MSEVESFQSEVESLAQSLAKIDGSRAFDPTLPDDPSRQPERERYRGLAVTRLAAPDV